MAAVEELIPQAKPQVSAPVAVEEETPMEHETITKAPATPAAKKPKTKKIKVPGKASHPTYFQMIEEAIKSLKERTGSSPYAIAKVCADEHKGLPSNFKKLLLVHLKKLVAAGKLVKLKASYKLPSTASKPKPKEKKAVVTKPKAKSTSAKPKASKPATKKKTVPKPVAKAKPAVKTVAKAKSVAKPATKAKPMVKAKPAAKPKAALKRKAPEKSKPEKKAPAKVAKTSTRSTPGKAAAVAKKETPKKAPAKAVKAKTPVKKTASRKEG